MIRMMVAVYFEQGLYRHAQMLRLPLVADAKEKYEGYARNLLLERSPLALPNSEADQVIHERAQMAESPAGKGSNFFLFASAAEASTPLYTEWRTGKGDTTRISD